MAHRYAKALSAALSVFLCLVLLCACGSEPAELSGKELLISRDWVNVAGEDVYSFYIDGSGRHGNIVLSYTFDPESRILEIWEAADPSRSYRMSMDSSGKYPRLLSEDLRCCYVTADDYEAAAELAVLFSAAPAGGAGAVDKVLLSDDWRNINDEDTYSFYADGTGKHGNISLSYSFAAGSDSLELTEGMGTVSTRNMHLNSDWAVPRLIPADKDTFYVRACDYEEISETVRSENISILTSVVSWQNRSAWYDTTVNNGAGDIRLVFAEGGKGRVLYYFNMKTYVDEPMFWSMLDNDTAECRFTAFGNEMDLDLDIRNKDGEYILYVHNDPRIYYLPDI